jgi:non-specific serine/threonine protein kinase
MVELAPVSDPLLVPQEAASALAVQEQPERSLTETLEDYLKPLSLLLLLDNCEHLLDGCAALVDRLLQSCPNLHILATSRERLRVPGELAYRVPSMKMPGPTEAPLAEQALEYEAVRLFVERTLFFREDFVLTDENLPDVIHICQRLDGSPLAIELAAARTRILTVEQIAQRLDDRFRLLTDGNRAALPRHQTLRATIDWSYDLLDEAERALVRRLSVFAGGWSLEAAEAIGAELATKERDVLHLLASLVDKSLVIAEKNQETGDMRYSSPGVVFIVCRTGRYQSLE